MARIAGHHDTKGQLAQLGVAIRSKRKLAGLSQEALADAAGIDRSHMGKIERGERNVTFLNLSRIAAAIQLRPSELLTEADL
ncbi:transcriptional regulator [Sphingobium sp. Leaf26]|uniref:helix-turn-helix domain-containing protein n=1 Tax=Sphingobium sp. Leaf26 TaxID=1735693 RepID=UPI0006F8E957|nr:helix-turn-helix transcriptional regulator [Sphingobium sp. Leaf26]KQM99363.1 transcriptional regulator [Sphingobium sp. Leaf26]